MAGDLIYRALVVFGLILTLSGCGGPHDFLLKGNLAYREGNLARAAALYGEALNSPETQVAAQFNLGRVFYDARNFESALQHLNAGLGADPEYLFGYYDRGRTQNALGNIVGAEDDFVACTLIDPSFARGWFELAKLHASQGSLSKAITEISHALADVVLQEEATLLSARWKTEMDNPGGAMRDLEALLASRPDLSAPHIVLGTLLLDLGDYREAERRFRSGLALQAFHLPGRLGLGQALEGQGRVDEAAAIYDEILRLESPESNEPEFETARNRLASLRKKKKLP